MWREPGPSSCIIGRRYPGKSLQGRVRMARFARARDWTLAALRRTTIENPQNGDFFSAKSEMNSPSTVVFNPSDGKVAASTTRPAHRFDVAVAWRIYPGVSKT